MGPRNSVPPKNKNRLWTNIQKDGRCMKFSYTISAEGNVNYEKIVTVLEELGLNEIFVEKFPDSRAVIAELSNKAESDLESKWQRLCEQNVIRREAIEKMVGSDLKRCKLLTRKILAEIVYKCCLELDMSESSAALLLCRVFENLK